MEAINLKDQSLLIPIKKALKTSVSPSNSQNTTHGSLASGNGGSPSSFRRKGSDCSAGKSSFSKRSSRSNEIELNDHNFEDAVHSLKQCAYLKRMNGDFDQRKTYEETVLKILNEYQRCKQQLPADHEEYRVKYRKLDNDHRKQTIFLDIDDTLVNVSLFQHTKDGQCEEIEIEETSGKIIKMYLYYRPGLFEFLEKMSQQFEIVLFNNSSKQYTDVLKNKILQKLSDKENSYCSYVLDRNHCIINEVSHEIKSLELFVGQGSNRNIQDCIIIDNNIHCFQNNMVNGLHIPKYTDILGDDWLNCLQEYIIEKLLNVEDVRAIISQDFEFDNIVQSSRVAQIRKMMEKHLIIEEEHSCDSRKDHDQYEMSKKDSFDNLECFGDSSIKNKYLNYLD